MNKKSLLVVLPFLILLLLPNLIIAESEQAYSHSVEGNDVILVEFSRQGCPNCAAQKEFLDSIKDNYPNLHIKEYEIHKENNALLFQEVAKAYKIEIVGVPTTFIDDKVYVGFSPAIGEAIEQEIRVCLAKDCGNPIEKVPDDVLKIISQTDPIEDPKIKDLKEQITLPILISAAAIDAINPCAFAVLILLLTTILAAGAKKRVLAAGLVFSTSIFISYFLMGLGLFSAIQASGATQLFFLVVAILAIIMGSITIKDYLWPDTKFLMSVPLSWRPKMKSLIRSVTSPLGAFFVGFLVSLFLLPCTSGPYIVILGLLAQVTTRNYALPLLLLYNFIFILPMIIITLLVYFGYTTSTKAEEWRQARIKVMHLIAGLIMILLGIGMLVSMWLGWI